MYDYVAVKKSEIEAIVPDLKQVLNSRKEEEAESPLADRRKLIDAIELIFKGLKQGEALSIGSETSDMTHCNCGMEIRLEDLGFGSINEKTATLINALAEHKRKLGKLKNMDVPEGFTSSIHDLQYSVSLD